MQQWIPTQLAAALRDGANIAMLDVRESWEYEIAHLASSRLIPLGQLTKRVSELNADQPLVVICHHGVRSLQACYWLERNGFEVINLIGGIDQWAQTVDPTMPLY